LKTKTLEDAMLRKILAGLGTSVLAAMLINVQAATTLHLMNGGDSRARDALATIKTVSQETLVELRSVLGVLRQVDEGAPRAPAPTLRRLDELIERASAAGLTTEVDIRGEPRALPAHVDLAAYRIVQEALTNVARHSSVKAATVTITFGRDDLVVQVDDDGVAAAATIGGGGAPAGNGITGMVERAAALGGNVQAGPRADGGFRVRAWLPLGDEQ
jgi:signal transduction histidine kinase